jgi:arabinogalactan oligomer/maltooligosaccharide transport system substrate-binding protein
MNQRTHLHLLISAALIAAFIFSTAGVQAAPAEVPTVTLRLWMSSSALTTGETAVLNAYLAAHPDIGITLYNPADLMGELASAAPGDLPDIIFYQNDAMARLLLEHYLTSLDAFGVTRAFLEAEFEPVAVEAAMFGTKAFAVPHLQEGIALVYNKDVVTDAYLPDDPFDFADLAAKAAQFKADFPAKTLICNQGFGANDAYHVAPIFFGYGIPDYIDENNTVYVNDPRAVAAAHWIQDIHAVLADVQDYTTCQNRLIAGEVGMWWTGPWAISALGSLDFGILPMGTPYVSIKQLMVTQAAVGRSNADEAVDFLLYFSNGDNSVFYATMDNLIPANTEALNDPVVQQLPVIQGFGAALALGTPIGQSLYNTCQWAPVGEAVDALWNDSGADPQALLDTAQAEVQDCINDMRNLYFPYSLNLPLLMR